MPTGNSRILPQALAAMHIVLVILSTFAPAVRAQSAKVNWNQDDNEAGGGDGERGGGGGDGSSEYRIGVGRADCTGPPVEVTFVSITPIIQ